MRNADLARLAQFFVYAKPIVVSLVIYQLIGLVNRYVALSTLGPAAAGKLSLAADLGQRLFGAINSLPELMLFQYALQLDRSEGRAAADRQLGVNMALVFACLTPLAVGYAVMAPTFEALLVPAAYRGDFARLSFEHRAGLLRPVRDHLRCQSDLPVAQSDLAGHRRRAVGAGDRSRPA